MKRYFFLISAVFLVLTFNLYCNAADYVLSGEINNGARVIMVIASQYKFTPDPIVVTKGEKVRLVVTSSDIEHGLAIAEFKVNIKIESGGSKSVEFIADKAGTFNVYCSVYCGPGHSRMQGKLIVL